MRDYAMNVERCECCFAGRLRRVYSKYKLHCRVFYIVCTFIFCHDLDFIGNMLFLSVCFDVLFLTFMVKKLHTCHTLRKHVQGHALRFRKKISEEGSAEML